MSAKDVYIKKLVKKIKENDKEYYYSEATRGFRIYDEINNRIKDVFGWFCYGKELYNYRKTKLQLHNFKLVTKEFLIEKGYDIS